MSTLTDTPIDKLSSFNLDIGSFERYIQKIIDLTNNDYLVWEKFENVYKCEWNSHVLLFEQSVDDICSLAVNDIEFTKQDIVCNAILQSLGSAIRKQIDNTNTIKFIEQLSFLDEIEIPVKNNKKI